MMGMPSSVKPTAPPDTSASMSVSSFPAIPFVTVAQVYIFASVCFPLSMTYASVSMLSTAGFVFAINTTLVKPPLSAAFAPVSISSLCVKPGSRKCTCTSTSPGATMHPAASITSQCAPSPQNACRSASAISCAILRIFPSPTRTSASCSTLSAGSTTVPFFIRIISLYLSSIYTIHILHAA